MFPKSGGHISAQGIQRLARACRYSCAALAVRLGAFSLLLMVGLSPAHAATYMYMFYYPYGIPRLTLQEAEQDLKDAAIGTELDPGDNIELLDTWSATVGKETRNYYHYRYIRPTGVLYNGPLPIGDPADCDWPDPSYSDSLLAGR
jgi:hypothetical protein